MGGSGSSSGKGGSSGGAGAQNVRALNSMSTKEKEAVLRSYDEGTEVTVKQGKATATYTKAYNRKWESQDGQFISTKELVNIASIKTKTMSSKFTRINRA